MSDLIVRLRSAVGRYGAAQHEAGYESARRDWTPAGSVPLAEQQTVKEFEELCTVLDAVEAALKGRS